MADFNSLKILFLVVTVLSLYLFYLGTGKNKKLLALFVVWQLLIGTIASLQIFIQSPHYFIFVILGTILLAIFTFRSIDIERMHLKYLLGIHVLRIPVELVLFVLYQQAKIPRLMTFVGANFDILIGISAFGILAYKLLTGKHVGRKFLVIWNIVGLSFLLIIVTMAVLSAPLPLQRLAFEQPNIAVLEFPYCFLPTCIVPIVALSHLIQIKNPRILGKRGPI